MWNKFVKFLFSAPLSVRFERNAGWFVFVSAVLIVLYVSGVDTANENTSWPFFWALFIVLAFSQITLYTRTLDEEGVISVADTDPDADINVLFRFAFAYVAAVIAAAGTFMIHPQIFSASEKAGADYTSRALAIVPGCDYSPPGSRVLLQVEGGVDTDAPAPVDTAGDATGQPGAQSVFVDPEVLKLQERRAVMPKGAFCGDIPPQWVVSIGGSILNCHIAGTCGDSMDSSKAASERKGSADGTAEGAATAPARRACPDSSSSLCRDPQSGLDRAISKRSRLRQKLAALQTRLNDLELLRRADAEYNRSEPASLRTKIGELGNDLKSTDADIAHWAQAVKESNAAQEKKKKDESVLNNLPGRPIVGGIVVPVYFLAIAVLGACVGMVRKLPEYHRRATTYYRRTYDPAVHGDKSSDAPLDKGKARDFIVFQALQVAFAPAVALLAYSFVRPDDVAAAALLGFAAGYASEIFLMVIRDVSNRLIGLGLRPVRVVTGTRAALDAAGAAHVGRRVMLQRPLGTFGVGSIGVVTGVQDGKLIVTADRDEHNTQRKRPETFKPKPLSFFRLLD